MFLTSLLILFGFLLMTYLWFRQNSKYWEHRNVPHPKPHVFFGNFKENVFMRKTQFQICTEIYNNFQEFPYVGFFKMRVPGVIIRDPKLVYDVLTKDFNSFESNDMKVDEEIDPLVGKNPFFLSGQKWKIARGRLTKGFTSGRLKSMLPLMVKVCEDMVEYVEKHISSDSATLETKEMSAKFTTDNVASCGFGLEAKSFRENEAEFRKMGQKIFNQSFGQMVKIMLLMLYPRLAKYLKTKFVPSDVDWYFRNVVKSTLQYREENNIVRNDFLDVVNEIRYQDPNYSIEDVTSNAFSFFLDGFETSSMSLSFIIYDLAANPLVQEKVRKEIEGALQKHKNVVTYESLQEMSYLDCAISESLRLHPPAAILTKTCTKDYSFPALHGNREDLMIKIGTPIVIPIYGIHKDHKYFANPDTFDPDRFSEENRSGIAKGSYLPFGDGPRACLGQKFALLQIKVALVALIKNFEVRVNKKTREPLEADEKHFLLSAKGGLIIDYRKRKLI